MLLQSPAGVDDVYNYYVSRMRVGTAAKRAGPPVTGGGNEVLSSANIYVMPGFESHPSASSSPRLPVLRVNDGRDAIYSLD